MRLWNPFCFLGETHALSLQRPAQVGSRQRGGPFATGVGIPGEGAERGFPHRAPPPPGRLGPLAAEEDGGVWGSGIAALTVAWGRAAEVAVWMDLFSAARSGQSAV